MKFVMELNGDPEEIEAVRLQAFLAVGEIVHSRSIDERSERPIFLSGRYEDLGQPRSTPSVPRATL